MATVSVVYHSGGSGLASERVCQGRDLSPFQRAK